MRTTIDIPDDLMADVLRLSACRTKRDAVIAAMREYTRQKLRAEMLTWFGNYDYGMTNDELEATFADDDHRIGAG